METDTQQTPTQRVVVQVDGSRDYAIAQLRSLLWERYTKDAEFSNTPLVTEEMFDNFMGGFDPTDRSQGSLLKRFARCVRVLTGADTLNWHTKMVHDRLAEFVNILSNQIVLYKRPFDWNAGDYFDKSSCYFNSRLRRNAPCAIIDSGGEGWVAHAVLETGEEVPLARLWVWRLTPDGHNLFVSNTYAKGSKHDLQAIIGNAIARHYGAKSSWAYELPLTEYDLKVDRQKAMSGLVYINRDPFWVIETENPAPLYNLQSITPSTLHAVLSRMDKTLVASKLSTKDHYTALNVSLKFRHGYTRYRDQYLRSV